MLNRDPPKIAATAPAVMAVYRPAIGGTPTATARAMESGNAMMPTTMPERTFVRSVARLNVGAVKRARAASKGTSKSVEAVRDGVYITIFEHSQITDKVVP